MGEFRTIIEPAKSPFLIHPKDRMMAIGSCFAVEMGAKLVDRKFSLDLNPFGILFNPISIGEALQTICKGEPLKETELIAHGGLWHSLRHHGSFSGLDQLATLARINERIERAHKAIGDTDWVLLTLGSAHVYRHSSTGIIAANCHKMPAGHFEKIQLTVKQIDLCLQTAIQMAVHKNPNINFILSVSPVRYWRDGPVENQRSKSRLILASELICNRNQNVFYFPAYEILMDDLRDYRFYAEDLLHPSKSATQYIWDTFVKTYFSQDAIKFADRFGRLAQSLRHQAIHPDSPEELLRIQNLRNQIGHLQSEFPHLDFEKERKQIDALTS